MKHIEYYQGREQTYLKHFFLESYLERVAYVIGWSYPHFVYIDGFSGPWKSDDEHFEDTSFVIAINKLRLVRDGLAEQGKRPRIRCLFVEKDPRAFSELQRATRHVTDLEVTVLPGEFEALIPKIIEFVGSAFSLTFIDPTGWTGFGLDRIAPILRHLPGEVIVNFMYDYINRFIQDSNSEASFDALMGGPVWQHLRESVNREEEIVNLYRDRIKAAGSFKFATWTRILKPLHDRSYFYLHYCTRHVKGLQEFRKVEKKMVEKQEQVRLRAKQADRVSRTGQSELFDSSDLDGPQPYNVERRQNAAIAKMRLREILKTNNRSSFEQVMGTMLEIPLVWQSDVQEIIRDMRNNAELEILGLSPRERTFKKGHFVVPC